jgi:hypothetical protein
MLAQSRVDFFENFSGGTRMQGELATHADLLAALAWKRESEYHGSIGRCRPANMAAC